MTTEDDAQKSTPTKKRKTTAAKQPKPAKEPKPPPPPKRPTKAEDVKKANGGLSGKQALALWELILMGDAKLVTELSAKLEQPEVKGLESAGLVTVQRRPRKGNPDYGSKLYVTDAAWDWANRQGFKAILSLTSAAVPVFETLLDKVGAYLNTHELALHHLLRPRREDPEPSEAASIAVEEQSGTVPSEAAPATLEERIRNAYLRVTSGALNKYVRLAALRAELRGEAVESVDAELRGMQERGGAILYPVDDPQALRQEDDAAALRLSGERRDLLFIKG